MKKELFHKATKINEELNKARVESSSLQRAIEGDLYRLEFAPEGSRSRGGVLYISEPEPFKELLKARLETVNERIKELEKEFEAV